MLAELKIENVAVIEKAEVQFTPGLNVLTGETGAGKSIMIDSINAILGNRTSRDLVRSGAPKARIWATFESIPAHVREQVEKCGYGAQDDLLLYREISADGKGSCRINGMPATAGVVRDISAGLLTIHGQHDSTSLTNPATHLALLDQYAQLKAQYADKPKKRVFLQFGINPPFTSGKESIQNQVLEVCGGENIFKDSRVPWPQVSREQVLARSPQAIVITGGPDQIPKIKQYWGEQLKIPVIPLTSDWFERASPRIILAAQQLCNALSQVD